MRCSVSMQMDVEIFKIAKQYGKDRGISFSAVIHKAMGEFFARQAVITEQDAAGLIERTSRAPGRPPAGSLPPTPSAPPLYDEADEEFSPDPSPSPPDPSPSPPAPICARCLEVVEQCRCPEGPERI